MLNHPMTSFKSNTNRHLTLWGEDYSTLSLSLSLYLSLSFREWFDSELRYILNLFLQNWELHLSRYCLFFIEAIE